VGQSEVAKKKPFLDRRKGTGMEGAGEGAGKGAGEGEGAREGGREGQRGTEIRRVTGEGETA
jgi:hypothetical protein